VRRLPLSPAWLMCGVLSACQGGDKPRSSADQSPDDTAAPDAACAPSTTVQPLRRLSKDQLQHTLADFVDAHTGLTGEDAAWLRGFISEELTEAIPDDTPTGSEGQVRGGFRRLDQVVYAEHVEGLITVAEGITTYTDFGGVGGAQRLVGDTCEVYLDFERGETGCVETWVRRIGHDLHRRPLNDAQVADYLDLFAAAADEAGGDAWAGFELGFHHVFVAMMASPWFGYHVEVGTGGTGLTDYELASRLSYHFWQTAPDTELYAAAADGLLSTDDGFRAQVERLVADPRTERALATFAEDFFRTHELPRMDTRLGTNPFDTFAADAPITSTLHEEMGDELVALTIHHTLREPGTVDDLFLSDRHVSQGEALSALYGEAPWDGVGTPPGLSDTRRVGLLTRAALLATGSANTRPIMKGVFIREGLLCEPIPPPPDNANAFPPELSDALSTREVVENLTEQPDSDCIVCHGALINPLGFATEDFDALGRPRSEQALYDLWGDVTGHAAIDTSGETTIAGQAVAFADVHDLTSAMLASGSPHRCMARELFRFTTGRPDDAADDCTLDSLGAALDAGETLQDALVRAALTPQFRTRGGAEVAPEETAR